MFWCCLPELDLLFGLLIIIVYGLVSLRHKHVALRDVQLFCCCWPLLMLFGYFNLLDLESSFATTSDVNQLFAGPLGETSQGPISYLFVGLPGGLIDALSLDIALCVLTAAILVSFKSFESLLLIMMGYIGQAFMLHSCNLVSFFVCLEMQNFSFLVLAGLTTPRSCDIDHEYWPIGSLAHGGPQGQALGTVHMKQHVLDSSSQSGFRVMAALKYMLLSAFSSGMILFWFSQLYLRTGSSVLFLKGAMPEPFSFGQLDTQNTSHTYGPAFQEGVPYDLSSTELSNGAFGSLVHEGPLGLELGLPFEALTCLTEHGVNTLESFLILLGLLFKLGAAPIHLWVVHIYQSIARPLLMYISTAPKLSLFGFWVSAWHMDVTVFTSGIAIFACFSLVLGCFGAYGQPALRLLFAYSTINEIGLLLLAVETAGFHTLFQHLSIYIASQLLLWNLYDKRVFSLVAVSLAGLPPLSGFFGKAWIFWHASSVHAVWLLIVALFCTGVSLVYYLRVLRIFWYRPTGQVTSELSYVSGSYTTCIASAEAKAEAEAEAEADAPEAEADAFQPKPDAPEAECECDAPECDTPELECDAPEWDWDAPECDTPELECDAPEWDWDAPEAECDAEEFDAPEWDWDAPEAECDAEEFDAPEAEQSDESRSSLSPSLLPSGQSKDFGPMRDLNISFNKQQHRIINREVAPRVFMCSLLSVSLLFAPVFLIKPFVL